MDTLANAKQSKWKPVGEGKSGRAVYYSSSSSSSNGSHGSISNDSWHRFALSTFISVLFLRDESNEWTAKSTQFTHSLAEYGQVTFSFVGD